jgi:hypothetical protein
MITEGFEPPSSCTSRRRSTAELRDLKRADGRDRTGVLLAGNEALYRQSFIRNKDARIRTRTGWVGASRASRYTTSLWSDRSELNRHRLAHNQRLFR